MSTAERLEPEPHVWMDPTTGEMVAEDTPGAVMVWLDELVEPPERASVGGNEDRFLDWYVEQALSLEALVDLLKAQARLRINRELAKLARLRSHWGTVAENAVRHRVGEKKRGKFIDTSAGRLGLEKDRKTTVSDEDAALEWAAEHAPDAIRVKSSLLVSALPEGADVPGVQFPDGDRFYCRPPRKPKKKMEE